MVNTMKEMFPPEKCPKCKVDTVVMHYTNGYRVECPRNPTTQYCDYSNEARLCDWYGEFVFDEDKKTNGGK